MAITVPCPSEIRRFVLTNARYLVPLLVLHSRCKVKVRGCFVNRRLSVTHGNVYYSVVILVETNNAETVWGNIGPLRHRGPGGYNDLYLSAFFDGLIAAKYGRKVTDIYSVSLDVTEKNKIPVGSPYFLELEKAIKLGYVSKDSPIGAAASKYELSHVAIYGTAVVGPSPDTIRATEWFCKQMAPKRVLDVFAGTGALTKVALRLGAEEVTMVDIGGKPPMTLTKSEWRRVSFTSADVEDIHFKRPFDLAILDPFCDEVLRFSKVFTKRVSSFARHILFHLGWNDRRALLEEALLNLEQNFVTLHILQINDSMIYIGQSRSL